MNIPVSWANEERTALRWDFGLRWDLEDLLSAQQASNMLLNNVDHVVDFVFNFNECVSLPKNAFNHLRYLLRNKTDYQGVVILVNCNRFIEVMVKNFSKFHKEFGEGMVFVETMEEAYELVSSVPDFNE